MTITKFPQKNSEEKTPYIIEELADLPPEVLSELSESYKKGNGTQTEIDTFRWLTEIFEETKAPVTIDEIIVLLYRKKNIVIRRNNLSAKLHNLEKKGKIIRPTSKTVFLPNQS